MGKSITHHQKSTACKNNSIAVTAEARTLPENAHQLGVTPVIHARSLIQPRLAKPTSYPSMGITAIEEADVGEAEAEADAVVAAEVAGVSQREPNLLLHQPQLINPNLKKKINRQVTIVERAQEDGRCQALDFDYGY